MKRINWFSPSKLLVIMASLSALAIALYAATVFQPSSQPAKIVSAYTLQDTNLEKVGDETKAYRAWYENGSWQGDIIEYDISYLGTRYTDVPVGYSPAATVSDSNSDGYTNWSARSAFAAAEGQHADGATSNPVLYDGIVTNTNYWKEVDMPSGGGGERRIFTSTTGTDQVQFLWSELTTDQKDLLDPDAVNSSTDPYESQILNFVRGDRSNEFPNGAQYRFRWSLMGDVIRSQPIYIQKPVASFTLPYYADFKSKNANRPGRVFVGANDGMLHALSAGDNSETGGSEVYAYIPSMVIPNLSKLTIRPYLTHAYFVDGELYAGDACPNDCNATVVDDVVTVNPWRTFLTGGLGAGGKGLWALDVTTPDFSLSKILWEKKPSSIPDNPNDHMGHVYNRPQIAHLPNGKWYVLSGNGYGSGSGDDALYLFSLDNSGTDFTHLVASSDDNGLSGLTLVDINSNSKADIGYAGDLKGNLYKFYFLESTQPNISGATCNTHDDLKICHHVLISAGEDKPITVTPDVGFHPKGGYMVYFGTGSLLSFADASNTDSQSIYGIWDKPGITTAALNTCGSNDGQLVCPNLASETYSYIDPDGEEAEKLVRYATGDSPNWEHNRGWRVDLPTAGERLLGNPQLRAERLQLITTDPTTDSNDSWLMGLEWLSGGSGSPPKDILYDLNQDGNLDSDDKVTVSGESYPVVAINLGPGNLSQPTIARVTGGIDIHFINGLLMPQLAPEFLNGLVDVTTDSPYGGAGTDSFENKIIDEDIAYYCPTCLGSPSEPLDSPSDGLGGLPDGHVHAYDKVHAVNYADFLELEPRRGKKRIDAYTGIDDDSVTDPDWAYDGSVKDTLARLNRLGAYDDESSSWESPEPYANDNKDRIDPSTNFVVLLTNADLSPGAVLQIGCRIWPVKEYQDMITEQLTTHDEDYVPILNSTITPNELNDDYDGTLVFNMNAIRSGVGEVDNNGNCTTTAAEAEYLNAMGIQKSEKPTLRIFFNNRVLQTIGILPTVPECVWGIQDPTKTTKDTDRYYTSPSDYLLGHVTKVPTSTFSYCSGNPSEDYILNYCIDPDDPDLDPARVDAGENASSGYRWRNGALTLQLVAVGDGNYNIADLLQPPAGTYIYDKNNLPNTYYTQYLPIHATGKTSDKPKRVTGDLIGGIFARAFKSDNFEGGPLVFNTEISNSGLLYEASLFVDGGAYLEYATGERGRSCYGTTTYSSQDVIDLVAGMNAGQYSLITNIFYDENGDLNELYDSYVALWGAVYSASDENALEDALAAVASFYAELPVDTRAAIELYDRLRNYVGEKVWRQDASKILPIDRYDYGVSQDDTPEQVEDISQELTPVLGPNFITGRRTWIDLRP